MRQPRPTRGAFLAFLALLSLVPHCLASATSRPEVTIANGTILGTHNSVLEVDSFLGIPYAQPPVGSLRFSPPQPLNTTWTTPLDASAYGPWCLGYSINLPSFTQPDYVYPQSEDCLTLNVVRPANITTNTTFPILLWIHGGGFADGGSSDGRYNLSTLAATSATMGTPTIIMSINYRLSGWGFLASRMRLPGNNGLRDQMLALAWVQDNIRAFGGDPRRVTIFGESAGAFSVGAHLLAYANTNVEERPFRAAIAESGSALQQLPAYSVQGTHAQFAGVLAGVNCSSSYNTTTSDDEDAALSCLRAAPVEALQAAFAKVGWWLRGDDDLLPADTLRALESGAFARVPLLIGTSTNEGTVMVSASGAMPVNGTSTVPAAAAAVLGPNILPNATVDLLLEEYQTLNLSRELGTVLPDPEPEYGPAYGLATLFITDVLFAAGRRVSNQVWDEYGVPSYSYRFNTIPNGIDPLTLGATHFQEIGFVFADTTGQGWSYDPFAVQPAERRERYEGLARLISRMWISFANTLSPNNHGLSSFDVEWPVYNCSDPVNMVFDGNATSYLEKDDWRAEIIDILRNADWCASPGSQC